MLFNEIFPNNRTFKRELKVYIDNTQYIDDRLYKTISGIYGDREYIWDELFTIVARTAEIMDDIIYHYKLWTDIRTLDIKALTHTELIDELITYRLNNETDNTQYKKYGDTALSNTKSILDNPVDTYNKLLNNNRYRYKTILKELSNLFLPYTY